MSCLTWLLQVCFAAAAALLWVKRFNTHVYVVYMLADARDAAAACVLAVQRQFERRSNAAVALAALDNQERRLAPQPRAATHRPPAQPSTLCTQWCSPSCCRYSAWAGGWRTARSCSWRWCRRLRATLCASAPRDQQQREEATAMYCCQPRTTRSGEWAWQRAHAVWKEGGHRNAAKLLTKSNTHALASHSHQNNLNSAIMGLALVLQCTSALLSWYFSACGSMHAADVCFNASHIVGALGVGAAVHVSWDLMMAATALLPGVTAGWLCCWLDGMPVYRAVRLSSLG